MVSALSLLAHQPSSRDYYISFFEYVKRKIEKNQKKREVRKTLCLAKGRGERLQSGYKTKKGCGTMKKLVLAVALSAALVTNGQAASTLRVNCVAACLFSVTMASLWRDE